MEKAKHWLTREDLAEAIDTPRTWRLFTGMGSGVAIGLLIHWAAGMGKAVSWEYMALLGALSYNIYLGLQWGRYSWERISARIDEAYSNVTLFRGEREKAIAKAKELHTQAKEAIALQKQAMEDAKDWEGKALAMASELKRLREETKSQASEIQKLTASLSSIGEGEQKLQKALLKEREKVGAYIAYQMAVKENRKATASGNPQEKMQASNNQARAKARLEELIPID